MGRRCRTDCLQRPLTRAFRSLGGLVGAHPWPFVFLPIWVSALAFGFMELPSRKTNDIEAQFTPRGGPAKAERRLVQQRFPMIDSERFSGQRLTTDGAYACVVVEAAKPSHTVLTPAAFAEVLALDAAVQRIQGGGKAFAEVCVRRNNTCRPPNPLLSALGGDPARIEALLATLTFPFWQKNVFLGIFLGGVTLDPGPKEDRRRHVSAAKALRLFYYVQQDDPARREASLKWLESFQRWIPNLTVKLRLTSVQVAYYSSVSMQQEFDKNFKAVIPLFTIIYTLTVSFSILSCARLDCIRTKVWVAAFGVLSSGLAVVSSFGLLLFCGVPFVITAAHAPFLVLGVGVDDMFILVSCWQKTKVKDTVRDRMADTYAEAAVSVTITTLTDVLAFFIGVASAFPSIQSFCIYTGTAFIFCYIYNLTFVGATLALNARREERNRHWLTFMKVSTATEDSRSAAYNMCCVGGSYDETTGTEFEHPMHGFFRNHYGPFLVHPWTKVFVVVLYLGYLGSSIYGCTQIKEGIDLRNLATDHSPLIHYYDVVEEYFTEYGPRVMVVVTESTPYWNPTVRADIENCMKLIENSTYVDEYLSESWLRMYIMIAKRMSINIDDHRSFINNLPLLYQVNPKSTWDINLTNQEITASRFFIQTVNVTTSIDEGNLLDELRSLASDCKIPLIVYHPSFIYFDQYLVIGQNTIQNVVIAAGAMLFTSLLLIPSPLCSLWVTFAIVSVIVGVSGYMAFWHVHLDSISMINLVMCIVFSVDFSAHISYAFVSSKKPGINDKAVDALYRLGYPVVQGSVSTIMGVSVLSMASSYIFRTFFKIMFLVIFFGTVHGIVFIPVFLTFCQRLSNQQVDQDN